MARKEETPSRANRAKPRTTVPRKKRTEQADQPTTPAEEWGERRATGEIIKSGGHSAGINPARPDKTA